MELGINRKKPAEMDLADVVLEYEDLVSKITLLERRREELRDHLLDVCEEKEINVLRIGDVEIQRRKTEWKLWNLNKLKPYLMQRELWDLVEAVDRKALSGLVEKGFLSEEELEGMYEVETRYSLHVKRD